MVTMQSWMFLSSFQKMRESLLGEHTLLNLCHMGNGVMGIAFGTSASIFLNKRVRDFIANFSYIEDSSIGESGVPRRFPVENERLKAVNVDSFENIPGSPVAYWVSKPMLKIFSKTKQLYENSVSEGQNITANNERFLRLFWEIDSSMIGPENGKWVFYSKGGGFKKWYGNLEYVVDWSVPARQEYRRHSSARIIPEYLWFREGVTWTLVTSSYRSFRLLPKFATFDKTGSSIFFNSADELKKTLLFLNSNVCEKILDIFNSTVSLQVDDVRKLPFDPTSSVVSEKICDELVLIAQKNWNRFETSFDFLKHPLVGFSFQDPNLATCWEKWREECEDEPQRFRLWWPSSLR